MLAPPVVRRAKARPAHEVVRSPRASTAATADRASAWAPPADGHAHASPDLTRLPLRPLHRAAGPHGGPVRIQRKLRLGRTDDELEREADAAADRVTQTQASRPPKLSRAEGRGADDATAQRRPDERAAGESDGDGLVERVLGSTGQPLAPATRAFFETRFGRDLGNVRISADGPAARSAAALGARAYTVGQRIAFGAGEYAPATPAGRALLAHELAHTIQQSAGGGLAPATLQRAPDDYGKLTIDQLRTLMDRGDKAAYEELRTRYEAMSNERLARYNDPLAHSVYEGRTVPPKDAEGHGAFSKPGMWDKLRGDIKASRTRGIPRRAPSAVQPDIKVEGGTAGAARTDVPGLDGTVIGQSKRAGGPGPNPQSQFPPATDVNVLPHTHGHAEQHIADQLDAALAKVPPEQRQGRTVFILIEQEVCATCAQGAGDAETESGVLKKLAEKYPEIRFEIKNLESNRLIVLNEGAAKASSGPAPPPVPASPPAAPAPAPETKPQSSEAAKTGVTAPPAHEAPRSAKQQTSGAKTKSAQPPPATDVKAPSAKPAETASRASFAIEPPRSAMSHAASAALEYGAIALLAAQLDSVRGAEKEKAVAALEALTPQIEDLRTKGYNVTVTLVAEVPEKIDIAAIWAGIGDASQVVYFRRMFIKSAVKPLKEVSPYPVMRADVAPGDPEAFDPKELPFQAQIEYQMGEKYPLARLKPRPNFKFATRDEYLPAYGPPPGAAAQGPSGRFQAASVTLYEKGDPKLVRTYGLNRVLRISPGPPVQIVMVDLNDSVAYTVMTDLGMDLQMMSASGWSNISRTFEKSPGREDNYRIRSTFQAVRGARGVQLIEKARAEDLSPNWALGGSWAATIVWVQI